MTNMTAIEANRLIDQYSDHPTILFESSPIPTFVIDSNHVVTHLNRACSLTLGVAAAEVIGSNSIGRYFYGEDRPAMVDLIVDGTITGLVEDLFQDQYRSSLVIPDAYEAEEFFPKLGVSGRWLFLTATPLRDSQNHVAGAIATLQDITERKITESAFMKSQVEVEELVEQRTAELAEINKALLDDVARREQAEGALLSKNAELNVLNAELSTAHEHLVQSEKLASIGQLAAGVAHEINNPIGYIFSNFGTLENYLKSLFDMLATYEATEALHTNPLVIQKIEDTKKNIEMDFLKEDIPLLMKESKEGLIRVRKIVQDLKDFSHVDTKPDWQMADLNQGMDSTLNVVNNEIKYKAELVKEYGALPNVQCILSQINQVIMNLVVNAAQAIGPERGTITVSSGVEGESVWFEVSDSGSGIPKDVLPRIFDPFYTTKPVGKGTGLGLSLSYGIVQKHNGSMTVQTEEGKGSTFRVTLPIQQPSGAGASKEQHD
jgi:two-component system, NtrC family, sensor kinase